MNKTVNTIVWVILFLLIIPSSLVVASWNSLPGSHLYQFKLFAEQALVTITPSDQAKGTLQIAYTQRRFDDAKRLLADNTSGSGLSYLDTQINTTRKAIVETPDPVVRKQLAQQYIAALRDVNTQLEAQKQVVQSSNTQPSVTHIPTPTRSVYTQATPIPTPQPQIIIQQQTVVVYQIIQTQTQITNTITEIQQDAGTPEPVLTPTPTPVPPTPTPTPVPPTPTPTPRQDSNGHGDGWGQGGNPGGSDGGPGGGGH